MKRNPVVFPPKGDELPWYRLVSIRFDFHPIPPLLCVRAKVVEKLHVLPSVEGRQVASWLEYPGTPKLLEFS